MQDSGDAGSISGSDNPMEKRVATHSGRIPWTEETGGLQSMGSQRVGHVLGTQHEHKKGKKDVRKEGREGGVRGRYSVTLALMYIRSLEGTARKAKLFC